MRDDPAPKAERLAGESDMLWLLGQPQLGDFLDFVSNEVVGGEAMEPRGLADAWRAANEVYYELEESEAGFADAIECLPLDPSVNGPADALRRHPHFLSTFDTLPVTIEMVELGRLVVSQPHVACGFSEERGRRLGARPTPDSLFHYCQPLERELPPVTVEKLEGDRYRFSSPSTDLRQHEPRLLGSDEAEALARSGPAAGALAILVGFGSNFISAIRSESRLVLHNGYHRAYALLALGITHAPCIVQEVTRKDELRLAAAKAVSADPAFYFRAARPPVLKDFLDPRLARRFAVRPRRTVVEVELTIRTSMSVEM